MSKIKGKTNWALFSVYFFFSCGVSSHAMAQSRRIVHPAPVAKAAKARAKTLTTNMRVSPQARSVTVPGGFVQAGGIVTTTGGFQPGGQTLQYPQVYGSPGYSPAGMGYAQGGGLVNPTYVQPGVANGMNGPVPDTGMPTMAKLLLFGGLAAMAVGMFMKMKGSGSEPNSTRSQGPSGGADTDYNPDDGQVLDATAATDPRDPAREPRDPASPDGERTMAQPEREVAVANPPAAARPVSGPAAPLADSVVTTADFATSVGGAPKGNRLDIHPAPAEAPAVPKSADMATTDIITSVPLPAAAPSSTTAAGSTAPVATTPPRATAPPATAAPAAPDRKLADDSARKPASRKRAPQASAPTNFPRACAKNLREFQTRGLQVRLNPILDEYVVADGARFTWKMSDGKSLMLTARNGVFSGVYDSMRLTINSICSTGGVTEIDLVAHHDWAGPNPRTLLVTRRGRSTTAEIFNAGQGEGAKPMRTPHVANSRKYQPPSVAATTPPTEGRD